MGIEACHSSGQAEKLQLIWLARCTLKHNDALGASPLLSSAGCNGSKCTGVTTAECSSRTQHVAQHNVHQLNQRISIIDIPPPCDANHPCTIVIISIQQLKQVSSLFILLGVSLYVCVPGYIFSYLQAVTSALSHSVHVLR